MSETVAHNDDASNDISRKTQIEANRVRRAVGGNVKIYSNFTGDERIIVEWDHDIDGVCDLSKAAIINNVIQSAAAVELYSTRDGSEAVEFEVID
jgi:hypothetical protein